MARALALLGLAAALAGCSSLAAGVGPSLPVALLGPDTHQVVVEVSAVVGKEPTPGTLEHVRLVLANVTGKRVLVTGPTPMPPQGGEYRAGDLAAIHRATSFFAPPRGLVDQGRVVLHVLYLDGRMRADDAEQMTLGRCLMDHGVVAVFRDTYAAAVRTTPEGWASAAGEMDRYVLTHEVGHALGLVGNGVPMQRDHDDPATQGTAAPPTP